MSFLLTVFLVVLAPLLANLPRCFRAILNDVRVISKDPALRGSYEILYAYPGFWALFWYRLSHALLKEDIPFVSAVVPRLTMAVVRYATAIDIHPGAEISGEGILIDHGAGLVVGETTCIGGGVTLYHGVTLGNSGKKLAPGAKRHPTIGDRVVVGAGAKILGDIEIGNDVLVGANSIVTKPVPPNHTAVGVPAKVLCHNAATCKDVNGAAICELHRRLQKIEGGNKTTANSLPKDNIGSSDSSKNIAIQPGKQSRASVEEEPRKSMQTIPIMLPSPRENQPVLTFTRPPNEASDVASDDIDLRIALEKTGFSPRDVSDSSVGSTGGGTFILEPDTKRSAVGDILYSLRVLGEHDAIAGTQK